MKSDLVNLLVTTMELTRVINLSERYIERNVNLAKQEANLFSQFGVVSGVPFRHGDRSP